MVEVVGIVPPGARSVGAMFVVPTGTTFPLTPAGSTLEVSVGAAQDPAVVRQGAPIVASLLGTGAPVDMPASCDDARWYWVSRGEASYPPDVACYESFAIQH